MDRIDPLRLGKVRQVPKNRSVATTGEKKRNDSEQAQPQSEDSVGHSGRKKTRKGSNIDEQC